MLAGRIPPSTQEGVAALAAAITAAEPFSSLAADVEAAKDLHQQSCARAEIAAQLQTVVQQIARLTSRVSVAPGSSGSSGGGAAPSDAGSGGGSNAGRGSSSGGGDGVLGLPLQGFSMPDWQQYVAMLEAAVEPAKDANVSVTKVSGKQLLLAASINLNPGNVAVRVFVCCIVVAGYVGIWQWCFLYCAYVCTRVESVVCIVLLIAAGAKAYQGATGADDSSRGSSGS